MKKWNILLAGLLLSCFACDDFLAETPSDELTPESTQAFSELLMYEGYLPNNDCVDKMLYYMDDDIENNYPSSPYSPGYREDDVNNKMFFTWQPGAVNQLINETDGSAYSVTKGILPWKGYYERILGCNIILKYVDGSIGTDMDKNYLKGEAYGLRAFHYFQLVNTYGWPYNDKKNNPKVSLGVPVVTDPEIGALNFSRNTVEEVYEQIVEDIENSVKFFEKGKKEVSKYRVSLLTAHLLASRIYLYMENWDKALEHARMVMKQKELCDYTSSDASYIFLETNDDILWLYGSKDNVWGISDASLTYSAFVVSKQLCALFDTEGLTDARKEYFFTIDDDNLASLVKYPTSRNAYAQGVRVTEAYLNAIEALLEQYKAGDSSAGNEALTLLNDFRAKRYISVDGSVDTDVEMKNADELMEIYRLERRKELCFEGQRWFDLRRFGMPRLEKLWSVDGSSYEKYVLEEHDPMYVLEIPSYVMDFNGGIQPNESLSSPRLPVSL